MLKVIMLILMFFVLPQLNEVAVLRSRLDDLTVATPGVTASSMISHEYPASNSVLEDKISEIVDKKLLFLKQVTQSNSKELKDVSQLSGENEDEIVHVNSLTNRNVKTITNLESSVTNMKLAISNLSFVTSQNDIKVKNLTASAVEFDKEIDEVERMSHNSLSEINNLKAQVNDIAGSKNNVPECCIINRNSITNLTSAYISLKTRLQLQNQATYHLNASLHKITDVLKSNHHITSDLITVSMTNQEKIEFLMNKTSTHVNSYLTNESVNDTQTMFQVGYT